MNSNNVVMSLLSVAASFCIVTPSFADEPVFSVTGYLSPQPVTKESVEWRSKKTSKATQEAQKERYEQFVDGHVVDSYDDEDKLFDAAIKYLAANPSKRLIFYIHGCCHLYPDTLASAKKLSDKLSEPVLVYNWPSSPFHIEPSKWQSFLQLLTINRVLLTQNGYSENEQGYSNGKGQFCFFFQRFDDALNKSKIDGARVIVLAHSMGNRFLDDELETRAFINQFGKREMKKFKKVIFACADVGMEEFQDFTRVERVGRSADTVYILINQKDPALKVSSRIHGYSRVGNISPLKADAFLISEDKNFKVIDHTKVTGSDHGLPLDLIVDLVNESSKSYKLVPNTVNPRVFEATR